MDNQLQAALFLAIVVTAVMDYLKQPLINTPKVALWLVAHGWAYIEDKVRDADLTAQHMLNLVTNKAVRAPIVIWPIPYVTFLIGLVLTIIFNIDIVSAFIPDAGLWPAKILTAIIVGCGSNLIHDVTSKR
jgi:hypothetical protein